MTESEQSTEIVHVDGEATCPKCSGFVSRLVPTTRIESLWLGEDGVDYATEDYDDEMAHAWFECNDCNATLVLPQHLRTLPGERP